MFKRRETLPPLRQSMPILLTPAGQGRRRRPLFDNGPRRRPDLLVVLCVVAGLWLAWAIASWIWTETRVHVEFAGVEAGAALTGDEAEGLVFDITIDPVEDVDRATVTFGAIDITDVLERDGDTLRWVPGTGFIVEGEHELKVSVPRMAFGSSTHSTRFVVDLTPPKFDLPHAVEPAPIGEPVNVTGRVDPEAEVTIDGKPYETDDGVIELAWEAPPAAPLMLEATDPAGNRTRHELIVPVQYPGGRSVHVTPAAWQSPNLRQGILDLIDEGRIDTVELDIKDEGGMIGHRSAVPEARRSGASQDLYELRDVVRALRDRGVRVVGRLVVFRDPKLAKWAVDNGQPDLLIQQPDGSPHPAYGGFTNIASEEVWDYNIALALEAADAGVGDILYDYIRRPEGPLEGMQIPGLTGRPHDAVVGFLARSHGLLRARGVFQGASVFGIAASRPDPVAQDVPLIARHADYVSPMVYPALWVKGEYRVPDPNRMPYEIVHVSLADFQAQMGDTGKPLMPWLQDFSLGHAYGRAEVHAQIAAAASLGIDSFHLWDPRVTYTAEALEPRR